MPAAAPAAAPADAPIDAPAAAFPPSYPTRLTVFYLFFARLPSFHISFYFNFRF